MARITKTQNTVELHITGPNVTAEQFSRCVKNFFNMLNDVAAGISGKRHGVKWTISVKDESIGICATPHSVNGNPRVAGLTTRAIRSGLNAIVKRKKKVTHFSQVGLESLYELGSTIGLGEEGINSIRIRVGRTWNDISPSTVAHVDELLKAPIRAHGSIEGQMLALELSGRLRFGIDEVLTGKRIHCFFPESIYNDVIKALKQRVAAYGIISYQKNGEPKNIEIEHIKVFPSDDTLPQFEDIVGLYKN